MEFGAATAAAATLTKKLSNGYGVSGRSAYDGVFAAPIKLRAPGLSSHFDDYREIFGAAGASLGSSIPILEIPDERRRNDEVRRSKLDYAKVFGGFGNLDAAVPFEELIAEPKEKDSFTARSKVKGENQSCRQDHTNCSKEVPVASWSSNHAKRINMSYHKVNQGNEDGTNGTTHIAQLRAIPAYTQLIEEVNPVKMNRKNKSIPEAQDTYSGSHGNEGIEESVNSSKSFAGASPDNSKDQSSNNREKVKRRSDSIDLFFDECEISNGSDGACHVKVPLSETTTGNLNNHHDAMKPMPTKCQASKGVSGADSPSYSDDMVDSNSEVAASVAALRKAIEEAQVRMKVAEELMRRKKEGFPDRVKRKSNIELKAEGKKETKVTYKTMKIEEINAKQTFGEMDGLPNASYEEVKSVMRTEQVRSDLGASETSVAKEAVREAQKKLKSTQAKHKKEFEQKEAYHKGKILELREAENNKKQLPENNEDKVRMDIESSACEEPIEETTHRCQEVVDETKLIQESLENGTLDKSLKFNENGEVENKVTPFHEPEDYERNLGGQGSTTVNGEKVACKPEEDSNKFEGSFELEECKTNLRAVQELGEVEKNITQEQKGSVDIVAASSELEECELAEILERINNDNMSSQHGPDLLSKDKDTENLGCIDDRKKKNESGFQDINQETEHSCQREATDNTFSNKEPVEAIRVTQSSASSEEVKAEETGKTTETSSGYESDETEKLNITQVADTIIENEVTLEVNPEVHSCYVLDDVMVGSSASFQHQERYEETDPVLQETNDFHDKHAGETSSFIQIALELNEAVNQMQSNFETETSEGAATNIGDTDIKDSQNEDQCREKAENDCNLEMLVEDTTPESVEICKDAKETGVASNEAVELEKEHLKKLDEAKARQREREKEKLAVERAIREARERAFAGARERAALERAAAEARQKNISDGRERLGKTTSQANEKTPAEKAAMEAKLKAERAAVERATAEARARALERALSEKAASDARNKSDKSVAGFGVSRDNVTKQNFHSKSFSYGDSLLQYFFCLNLLILYKLRFPEVRDSSDVFDGADGDSAQRCKARFERHQRIGERVAKALAEKNMRDRLVLKEQEERNRVAEALDADVKRWSSGKTGNLRALLSTLQYILGPDSGWQPIPLTDTVTSTAVKKAYRKATLFVHPDKLQQRGASIQQKYICEKVFDLLKEAWNRFNMEER
uniref:UBA domain-containing protein 7 n=1 Tax=Cajanus cajan TaxID=3821 RepID=A0A151S971_CAJCA|nr:UBA domain-containing protein 7 [Cajanus cajan]